MNAKMLEKTVHFLNADLVEDTPTQGYRNISEAAFRTCSTKQSFLKITQNLKERICIGVFFQPAICNFIVKKTSAYIFFCVNLQIFLGTALICKTSCKLVLKGEFYEKWRTNVLIIKRFRKVDSSFKEETLSEGKCIFHRYLFSEVFC